MREFNNLVSDLFGCSVGDIMCKCNDFMAQINSLKGEKEKKMVVVNFIASVLYWAQKKIETIRLGQVYY